MIRASSRGNPYHDEKGRFTSGSKAAIYSVGGVSGEDQPNLTEKEISDYYKERTIHTIPDQQEKERFIKEYDSYGYTSEEEAESEYVKKVLAVQREQKCDPYQAQMVVKAESIQELRRVKCYDEVEETLYESAHSGDDIFVRCQKEDLEVDGKTLKNADVVSVNFRGEDEDDMRGSETFAFHGEDIYKVSPNKYTGKPYQSYDSGEYTVKKLENYSFDDVVDEWKSDIEDFSDTAHRETEDFDDLGYETYRDRYFD